jgi:hypothetical protein
MNTSLTVVALLFEGLWVESPAPMGADRIFPSPRPRRLCLMAGRERICALPAG